MTYFYGIPWNFEIVILINTMLTLTCMEYSMELHWTLESPNKKSSSSTGFHGIRRAPFQMTQVFHGIPWNIPWNSMELWCSQMKYHLVPWNFMEYSMEFHGTLVPPNEVSRHLVPWNSMELWDCHFMACYPGLPRDIPWNSMELWSRQIKNYRVPRDSMELGGRHFKWHNLFHGIPWNIPWNSMELWCRQMDYDLFPWNSVELWNCHFNKYHVTLDLHGIFHGITRNSGVAK